MVHTLGQLTSASLQLRRTLLRRLARAEELLPRPLEDNRIHVAAALEALSWTQEEER